MDLADRLKALATRIPNLLDSIQTEEATKNALIMPFISALGYDVFDPTEVTPELIADVGVKKGEKVDYAILKEGKPIILFECKAKGTNLNSEHASQLHRYFHTTDARFGILTNGIIYRFYTDLEKANKMDTVPFLEIDLLNLKEADTEEIRKFSKSYFDESEIIASASDLKYIKEIKKQLVEEFKTPSADFIRLFTSKFSLRATPQVAELFAEYIRQAYRQLLNDQINERLQNALDVGNIAPLSVSQPEESVTITTERNVETTPEEFEAYYMVKSILRETIDTSRIIMRDVQSYCGVLLDDNNRKPIIRLYFDRVEKQIGIFDNPDRSEDKMKLEKLDDLYKIAERLAAAVKNYDGNKS
jgi:predicted type IV restriction endonuclease